MNAATERNIKAANVYYLNSSIAFQKSRIKVINGPK